VLEDETHPAATVRAGERPIRIAGLGPESPLPMVGPLPPATVDLDADLPGDLRAAASWGAPPNLFPYRAQDGYDRAVEERTLPVVELANEHLRAVFLPGLGGRLWELTDLDRGVPLLHTPPAIRFANLALRNAWFPGGVEWNIGTRGHSPTTCAPLRTTLLEGPDGPGVRFTELERLRGLVLTIDARLPAGSRVLLDTVRVRNPSAMRVPLYWWSNAAVPETPATRVLAPATSAFRSDAAGRVARVDPTDDDGVDGTWPARTPAARDYFFDIPADADPWVVAADEHGDGLAMLSTRPLRGRKLFAWGGGPGGRRWQDWLNPGGAPYAEIQAGLARTQFEHVPLEPDGEVCWTEAYGNAGLDPAAVALPWPDAVEHAAARVAALLPRGGLTPGAGLRETARVAGGTGWAVLEERRRRADDEPHEAFAAFSGEPLGPAQQPWSELLATGAFPGAADFVSGTSWERRLETAPATADTAFHLATMRHARGALAAARVAYASAIAVAPPRVEALALRGLALLELAEGAVPAALTALEDACRSLPDEPALLAEAAAVLLEHHAAARAVALLDAAPPALLEHGRLRLLLATALERSGGATRARALLDGLEVPDVREGDDPLAELWQRLHPGEPVPAALRFGMHEPGRPSGLPQ
jgi:hypothetical protein